MKRALLLGIVFALSTSACTTVHIVEDDSPSPISATVSKARSAIIHTSKVLCNVFSDKNWAQENVGETQSAASILMQGLKKTSLSESNVDLYVRSVSSVSEVEADITLARAHVEGLSTEARSLISDNPDIDDVREELKRLEEALIVSRQAELTFNTAIAAISGEHAAQHNSTLSHYIGSVDGLRSVTDVYGAYMRGDLAPIAAG